MGHLINKLIRSSITQRCGHVNLSFVVVVTAAQAVIALVVVVDVVLVCLCCFRVFVNEKERRRKTLTFDP